jgi:D-alanyl-D-alanine carboxypeptidase (penicillin-binding protein 5/6)
MRFKNIFTATFTILIATSLITACSEEKNSNKNSPNNSKHTISSDGTLQVTNQPTLNSKTSAMNSMTKNQFVDSIPAAPTIDLNAAAWVLLDYETGEILSEKNMNAPRKPASLTKIMTAYIVAEALKNGSIKLDEKVHISQKAWKTGGSKMFVKPSDTVTVSDLLQGMIVQSGNDATVALAEFLAGSEPTFTILMNQTAKRLGMKGSYFTNSDGLPNPEQITTAYDMAILARAFIHNYPKTYKIYSQKEFSWNGIKQYNRNKLLDINPNVDGMKTGHTKAAGYNLVASSLKDNERLVSVVLGTPSAQMRVQESNKLLTFGNRFFKTVTIMQAGAKIDNIKVTGAEDPNQTISLTTKEAISLTLPKSQLPHVKKTININDNLVAPITKGQEIGSISISIGDKQVTSIPLYAQSDIEKAGFFKRTSNKVKSWF